MKTIESYKDNPSLKAKVVKTLSGQTEYRDNCKKIQSEYFIRDRECFEVDGKWYRTDTGVIILNHSTNKWVTKNKIKFMVKGIVDFTPSGTPIMGYFDANPCETVNTIDARTGEKYPCKNVEVALKSCKEDLSTGVFYYNLTAVSSTVVNSFTRIKNAVDNKQKGYNIEDNATEMIAKIKAWNAYPTPIHKEVHRYSKLLGDISFGAEAESIAGYCPEHIQYRNGIVVCRDGSLHASDGTQGPEYTTIPMTGAKGVQSLINMGVELTPRNVIDRHCSFHLHIGNLPTTRVFLVALYKLSYMIQDDVFKMFPYYKIDERKYAGKDKNYCKKLSRLSMFALRKPSRENFEYYVNDNYVRIFTFLTNGIVPCKEYNRKLGIHPKANEKWNRVARYHWVNFMNVIFSKRNTVEFRIHQGTLNPQKMVTWLFICNAIVKTAMLLTADILKGRKVTFEEVLDYYGNTFKTNTGRHMSLYLKEYVKSRTAYFKNDFDNNNYISEQELAEDKDFHFPFPKISDMFH